MNIRNMTIDDYDNIISLMQSTPGICIRDADSRKATERYLQRNPGLSFVAEENGQVVGCIMCGHDGRRGYLQHLVVSPAHRRKGIGMKLVSSCLESLESLGIVKTHIEVLVNNETAIRFWNRLGWKMRDDIHRFSFIKRGNANA